METILQFIPDGCLTKTSFHDFVQVALPGNAFQTGTIGYIIINALGEGVWLLENHAYMAAQHNGIDFLVNIYAGKKDLAFYAASWNQIIHAVQSPEECGFAAAGRSDEGSNLVSFNAHGNFL